MAQVRAFIAIQLPSEVKEALERFEAYLKAACASPHVKWVAVPSIHLTLKFLGDVDEGKIDALTVAIARAAEETPTFGLNLAGLGAFPNMRRVDVVWVGLGGDLECVCHLQQRIEQDLKPLGFRPEARPFAPHLTLARLRDMASGEVRQEMGKLIASAPIESGRPFKVDSVFLMRSQLMRSGPIYSELSRVRLSEAVQ